VNIVILFGRLGQVNSMIWQTASATAAGANDFNKA